MAKGIYRKTATGFIPVDEVARGEHYKCKLGQDVMMGIKRARNMRDHNRYWALCTIISDNSERWPNKERASDMLKIATGHYDEVQTAGGGISLTPRSMATESMPEAAFEGFFNEVVNLTCAKIIPGLDPGGLRAEIEELCGIGGIRLEQLK